MQGLAVEISDKSVANQMTRRAALVIGYMAVYDLLWPFHPAWALANEECTSGDVEDSSVLCLGTLRFCAKLVTVNWNIIRSRGDSNV